MTGLANAIIVISDYVDRSVAWDGSEAPSPRPHAGYAPGSLAPDRASLDALPVVGSYLERLPLAVIRSGMADFGEVWHYRTGPFGAANPDRSHPLLARRSFRLDGEAAPFHAREMLEFIEDFGPPAILCVWGLGVSEAILEACRDSFIIYNSIDAPALRVSDAIARHFDLVLTAAQWQSDEITSRLPDLASEILPIGPEFAAPDMFYPIPGSRKSYDVVYVAAAQPYKRHDILFEALRTAPRPLNALCVIGYGELGEALRRRAGELGLAIDFVGPPGVPYDEVNRLMNAARIGVVCGIDDGAPAILTEYMLAGLPVVANSKLRCGLQYIVPATGAVADPATFGATIVDALDRLEDFAPRQTVIDRWTWQSSVARLAPYLRNLPPTLSLSTTSDYGRLS